MDVPQVVIVPAHPGDDRTEVLFGVLAGGVVAYGVGDLVHNMIDENWGQDIHNDGVVGGVAVGTWHSVENTGKDMAHTAESIWHGVSSIF